MKKEYMSIALLCLFILGLSFVLSSSTEVFINTRSSDDAVEDAVSGNSQLDLVIPVVLVLVVLMVVFFLLHSKKKVKKKKKSVKRKHPKK